MIRFPVTTVEEILEQRATQGEGGSAGRIQWVDARQGPSARAAYARSHVADAVHVDLERDLSGDTTHPERGGRHPLPAPAAFATRLGAWGIGPDTTVLVYDDQGGANAAARFWWMLRALGHAKVAVVDGGWAALEASPLPRNAEPPETQERPPYPCVEWRLPTVDADGVWAHRDDPTWKLLDVRDEARFLGESEPVDPIAGHIPGALNLFYGRNLDAGGRFLPPEVLRTQYDRLLAGTAPDRLILQCGSGVTACHTLVALERAGLPGASLYVGSWSEWCRSSRPREPQMPPVNPSAAK